MTMPTSENESGAGEEIDRELDSFESWLKERGRPSRRHRYGTSWAGEREFMPTFQDRWTEGQWTGWLARSGLV